MKRKQENRDVEERRNEKITFAESELEDDVRAVVESSNRGFFVFAIG